MEADRNNRGGDSLQQRLQPVLELLERHELVEHIAAHDASPNQMLVNQMLVRQQQVELQRKLAQLDPAEVAHLLGILPQGKCHSVWAQVPLELAGEVLSEAESGLCGNLVGITEPERLVRILVELDVDDLSRLDHLLDPDILRRVAAELEAEDREWLEQQTVFPVNTVGSLMSRESLLFMTGQTVNEAVDRLRAAEELPEQLDKLFITDRLHRLVGEVNLTDLVTTPGHRRLDSIMRGNTQVLSPETEALAAGKAFEMYDLVSAPVVDRKGRVIGRLQVEAVMDFIREYNEAQNLARAGLSRRADLFAPVWQGARQRWLWLSINLVTAFVASRFIGVFEDTITRLVALATLMPIVASIGGNTGNQTVTLVIRGLALDQINRGNLWQIAGREVLISVLNGLLWGGVLGCFALLLYGSLSLGLVLQMATTLNLVIAAIAGVAVPMLLKELGRDPAVGSSVVLTFLTDSMGFFLFLGLASALLVG